MREEKIRKKKTKTKHPNQTKQQKNTKLNQQNNKTLTKKPQTLQLKAIESTRKNLK